MEVEETQTLQYYSIFLGKKMNSNQPDKDVQYKSVDGDGGRIMASTESKAVCRGRKFIELTCNQEAAWSSSPSGISLCLEDSIVYI